MKPKELVVGGYYHLRRNGENAVVMFVKRCRDRRASAHPGCRRVHPEKVLVRDRLTRFVIAASRLEEA